MHRRKLLRTWVGIASLLVTNQLATVGLSQQSADQPTTQLRPVVRPNLPNIAPTSKPQVQPVSSARDGRSYGGWSAVPSIEKSPVVRASYYQQFSDLPNLSGLGSSQPPPSLPADDLVGSLNDLRPVAPQPNYDAPADVSYNSSAAYNQPMQSGAPNLGGGYQNGGYPNGGPAGYDAPRLDTQPQQQLGLPNRIPANLAAYQNDAPNFQNGGQNFGNGQPAVLPNSNGAGNNLRNANPQGVYPNGQGGQPMMNGRMVSGQNMNSNPVASGYPFVSPPPGQRYLTSPYMGPKNLPIQYTSYQRNVSYQQPVPGTVMPQNVQPTMGQPVYNPNNPGVYPVNYQCADGAMGAYVPPTYTPNSSMYSANNNGYRPLFSLGQENYNVQLGRGLYGQPTVYVPGQPIRNFFRYIFP